MKYLLKYLRAKIQIHIIDKRLDALEHRIFKIRKARLV